MTNFRLPSPPPAYDLIWAQQLVADIESRLGETEQPAQIGYAPSNVIPTRTFDANAITLAELADVVGTLIEDLKGKGRLG